MVKLESCTWKLSEFINKLTVEKSVFMIIENQELFLINCISVVSFNVIEKHNIINQSMQINKKCMVIEYSRSSSLNLTIATLFCKTKESIAPPPLRRFERYLWSRHLSTLDGRPLTLTVFVLKTGAVKILMPLYSTLSFQQISVTS